jgi:hypothetical protein
VEALVTRGDWLVVGHGSVGSQLAARLSAAGASVSVLDPSPRVPVVDGRLVPRVAPAKFAYAISCVPPATAGAAAAVAAPGLVADGLLFDWNTVAPAAKRRAADATAVATVDVALLDTLDGARPEPTLAVAGPEANRAAEIFRELGFAVSVAGLEVGDAAALKYLRSIFMKTLEAMSIEFAALAAGVDANGIVRDSVERNLGHQFVDFLDLLVATDRVHADRRAGELADAVATFAAGGTPPALAGAAVGILGGAARAWAREGAPPEDADVAVLSDYLRSEWWSPAGST